MKNQTLSADLDAVRTALGAYIVVQRLSEDGSPVPAYLMDAIMKFISEDSADMEDVIEKCNCLSSALSDLAYEIETDISG